MVIALGFCEKKLLVHNGKIDVPRLKNSRKDSLYKILKGV